MSEPPAAPLRLGVLGCGRVFQRFHLPAIGRVPARALIAACDTEPARLAGAEHWSTHPALFSSPTELFRSPGLDALLVLTPPLSHADIVVQARR